MKWLVGSCFITYCQSFDWNIDAYPLTGRPDSVVGRATGYGLDDRGVGVRVPVVQEFSLLHVVQTGSGSSPNLLSSTGALSPGIKRPGREADHSPPASAEVKKLWNYTTTTPYAFMA
jgi:hypothetical protein